MPEFVRARHEETGHIAPLPQEALRLGMCPGWVEVAGPAPSGPKVAAFPPKKEPDGNESDEDDETETADTKSAKKKE